MQESEVEELTESDGLSSSEASVPSGIGAEGDTLCIASAAVVFDIVLVEVGFDEQTEEERDSGSGGGVPQHFLHDLLLC